MHFVYSYTSRYFPIYDDKYRRIHYDDDDDGHASHDTQGSADLRTSQRTSSLTMMGVGGTNRTVIHKYN